MAAVSHQIRGGRDHRAGLHYSLLHFISFGRFLSQLRAYVHLQFRRNADLSLIGFCFFRSSFSSDFGEKDGAGRVTKQKDQITVTCARRHLVGYANLPPTTTGRRPQSF